MKKIDVVAAIIKHNDKVLCVQRGDNKFNYIANKFEFPGGKIEHGESNEETIIREISEELSMDIIPEQSYLTVEYQYPDFFITMHSYICSCESTQLVLHEHVDYKWLTVSELENLDWAEADIPIVEKLIQG